MSDIITKILVEVLSILSLATKQIKQGRLSKLLCMICVYLVCDVKLEKFAKKLLGESEIEDVLHRLDRLTLDEARMTGTETLQIVHGLISHMKLVMGGTQLLLCPLLIVHWAVQIDGTTSMDDIWHALGMLGLQSTLVRLTTDTSHDSRDDRRDKQNETLVITLANCIRDTDRPSGHHLQKDIRSWLSPPDPSKNHNIARGAQHDGTAEWFTQGSTFEAWKATGSLLWIHGKRASLSYLKSMAFVDSYWRS